MSDATGNQPNIDSTLDEQRKFECPSEFAQKSHLKNLAEYEALYPAGRAIEEMPYPRAKAFRQVPSQTRERLAIRARRIGGAGIDDHEIDGSAPAYGIE